MKIIGIKVEGIRLLKAFQMKFQDKGLTQIRGKNKQGKSTVLDCIELLLRGNKLETKDMISHGKESAEIIGQVDQWSIKRVIKKDGANTLEVRDLDTKLRLDTKPQDFLNSLINDLTFNPLPWLGKSSDEKLRFIQDLTGLDLTAVDAEIKKAEQDRHDAGVSSRSWGDKPEEVGKVEAVSIGDLLDKLDKEKNKQHEIETGEINLKELKRQKVKADEEILFLEKELKSARTTRDQAVADVDNAKTELNKLPQPNIEEAQSAVDGAETINHKARAYVEYEQKLKQWTFSKTELERYQSLVKEKRKLKDEMLKKAKMPIKGMEIKDDGLYFDGTHCENWSDSEGYGIALNVCLAMNPKLKAIFIDRGELFDGERRESLNKWAEKHDIQIGITIVDDEVKESADGVFYIEDGTIL